MIGMLAFAAFAIPMIVPLVWRQLEKPRGVLDFGYLAQKHWTLQRPAQVAEIEQAVRTRAQKIRPSASLRGYINYEFAEHYPAFLRTVAAAVADGRIRYREDITDGLENAPAAFIGMLEGRNFGKALVRVAPSA